MPSARSGILGFLVVGNLFVILSAAKDLMHRGLRVTGCARRTNDPRRLGVACLGSMRSFAALRMTNQAVMTDQTIRRSS